ncbi:MAG: glutathione S-transferase family protein [Alphaproteobacteria bacterium]
MSVLHHYPLSAASRFVRLVFAEYGENPNLLEETPWARSDALLALNPAGSLPVLVDDNEAVISGGGIIAEYLAETRGERIGESQTLLPSDSAERAEARRLIGWFLDKMEAEVTTYLLTEKVYKRRLSAAEGGGPPDAAAIRAARSNIRYHMRYIGYLTARRDGLAGRDITFADLAAAAVLSVIDYMGEVPWEEDAGAKAWYARIKSRPSFRPILADQVRGLPAATHYADLDF